MEKSQAIVLFKIDFDHNNKFRGKEIMKHAILQKKITEEQYSIPKKQCIDHDINRRLLFETTKKFGNDIMRSKSYYDRIVYVPAILPTI